jgi:hypothetical protein
MLVRELEKDLLNRKATKGFYHKVRGGFRKGHKDFKSESLIQKSKNFSR